MPVLRNLNPKPPRSTQVKDSEPPMAAMESVEIVQDGDEATGL